MSFSSKLTAAIKSFTGRSGSSDAVSFELSSRGKIACSINGVGATGATPEIALTRALAEWARIRESASTRPRFSKRREPRRRSRRTSRR